MVLLVVKAEAPRRVLKKSIIGHMTFSVNLRSTHLGGRGMYGDSALTVAPLPIVLFFMRKQPEQV